MSFGPPLVIAEEFEEIKGLEGLFIFGSWAARQSGQSGPSPRDIDVLVVGVVDRDTAYDAAIQSERRLGREVNVTIRTSQQWTNANDAFSMQVKESPQLKLL